MTPQEIELIRQHPDFIQLVRRKQKLYWSLSLAMLVIYYGFVLLVAFSPSTLGQSLSGGVTTVGMLVGVPGLRANGFLCLSRQQRDRPAE